MCGKKTRFGGSMASEEGVKEFKWWSLGADRERPEVSRSSIDNEQVCGVSLLTFDDGICGRSPMVIDILEILGSADEPKIEMKEGARQKHFGCAGFVATLFG